MSEDGSEEGSPAAGPKPPTRSASSNSLTRSLSRTASAIKESRAGKVLPAAGGRAGLEGLELEACVVGFVWCASGRAPGLPLHSHSLFAV